MAGPARPGVANSILAALVLTGLSGRHRAPQTENFDDMTVVWWDQTLTHQYTVFRGPVKSAFEPGRATSLTGATEPILPPDKKCQGCCWKTLCATPKLQILERSYLFGWHAYGKDEQEYLDYRYRRSR